MQYLYVTYYSGKSLPDVMRPISRIRTDWGVMRRLRPHKHLRGYSIILKVNNELTASFVNITVPYYLELLFRDCCEALGLVGVDATIAAVV